MPTATCSSRWIVNWKWLKADAELPAMADLVMLGEDFAKLASSSGQWCHGKVAPSFRPQDRRATRRSQPYETQLWLAVVAAV